MALSAFTAHVSRVLLQDSGSCSGVCSPSLRSRSPMLFSRPPSSSSVMAEWRCSMTRLTMLRRDASIDAYSSTTASSWSTSVEEASSSLSSVMKIRSISRNATLSESSRSRRMIETSAIKVCSKKESPSLRTRKEAFSSFCLCTSRMPARSLVASARNPSNALASRCRAMSSSSFEPTPFRRFHTLLRPAATFLLSCMMIPRSSSSSSVTGSSTVRGSSRALAIMRRSLGRVSLSSVAATPASSSESVRLE
mmetsp:Transcript_79924/g.193566  ORF Transcript_79924/g.193566 Transcript_79924/m.193566 type:complete len:251 (+) Transcript_79924:323-1075(+)